MAAQHVSILPQPPQMFGLDHGIPEFQPQNTYTYITYNMYVYIYVYVVYIIYNNIQTCMILYEFIIIYIYELSNNKS